MKIILQEDHHTILLKSGYFPYGSNYSYKKMINFKNESNKSYFHAIVDYYNRCISIHIDTHKNSVQHHKTVQRGALLDSEKSRILSLTFNGKIELIRQKFNQPNFKFSS